MIFPFDASLPFSNQKAIKVPSHRQQWGKIVSNEMDEHIEEAPNIVYDADRPDLEDQHFNFCPWEETIVRFRQSWAVRRRQLCTFDGVVIGEMAMV